MTQTDEETFKFVAKLEVACPFDGEVPIKAIAYRTHSHALGRVISGYIVRDNEWIELGRKSPQLPQVFYFHQSLRRASRTILL